VPGVVRVVGDMDKRRNARKKSLKVKQNYMPSKLKT